MTSVRWGCCGCADEVMPDWFASVGFPVVVVLVVVAVVVVVVAIAALVALPVFVVDVVTASGELSDVVVLLSY